MDTLTSVAFATVVVLLSICSWRCGPQRRKTGAAAPPLFAPAAAAPAPPSAQAGAAPPHADAKASNGTVDASDASLAPAGGVDGVSKSPVIYVPEAKATDLGQEDDTGNIEFKWKLTDVGADRLEHLVTQMQFRLTEGGGECLYQIGVEDDGNPLGLSDAELHETIQTIKTMAGQLHADVQILHVRQGTAGVVAELLVRQLNDKKLKTLLDVRVCVVGNMGSGKSTLVGVLTRGAPDDGRGSARMTVFRHPHELVSGRTCSVSHHLLGFDQEGAVVNHRLFHKGVWPDILRSAAKTITFIDLAGHQRYMKTTVFGLTGQHPDYVMLPVAATSDGLLPMTVQHLSIALALPTPMFVVLTKLDVAPAAVCRKTFKALKTSLQAAGRAPLLVKSQDDVYELVLRFSTSSETATPVVPVFLISNVTMAGIESLTTFLNLLPKQKLWAHALASPARLEVEDHYWISDVGVPVVGGTLLAGRVALGDTLLVGPSAEGEFHEASVTSIHVKKRAVRAVPAGQKATFALAGVDRSQLRKGLVLLGAAARATPPMASFTFEAAVRIIHEPTAVRPGSDFEVHIGTIRQKARILSVMRAATAGGDDAGAVQPPPAATTTSGQASSVTAAALAPPTVDGRGRDPLLGPAVGAASSRQAASGGGDSPAVDTAVAPEDARSGESRVFWSRYATSPLLPASRAPPMRIDAAASSGLPRLSEYSTLGVDARGRSAGTSASASASPLRSAEAATAASAGASGPQDAAAARPYTPRDVLLADELRCGDHGRIVFQFCFRSEYIEAGDSILFRTGFERLGVGRVERPALPPHFVVADKEVVAEESYSVYEEIVKHGGKPTKHPRQRSRSASSVGIGIAAADAGAGGGGGGGEGASRPRSNSATGHARLLPLGGEGASAPAASDSFTVSPLLMSSRRSRARRARGRLPSSRPVVVPDLDLELDDGE